MFTGAENTFELTRREREMGREVSRNCPRKFLQGMK